MRARTTPFMVGHMADFDVIGACTITARYQGHDGGRTVGIARTPVCV